MLVLSTIILLALARQPCWHEWWGWGAWRQCHGSLWQRNLWGADHNPISATMGGNVFPLNEIEEESPHFERIHEALSTVMRENGISQLDRASSIPMFWIMALIHLGINANSDEIRKQFLVTNDESFRGFCRRRAPIWTTFCRFRRESVGWVKWKSSLCQRIQGEALRWVGLKLITSYTRMYNERIFHSPYAALVQASMTGKSRLVKEMAQFVYCIHTCLREAGHTGYPEPRFAEFFRKFPKNRGRIQ